MESENKYIETDLGNVAPNPRGEYESAATYEYLDLVEYGGGSYLCVSGSRNRHRNCAGARKEYGCLAGADHSGRSDSGVHRHARRCGQ